MTEEAPFGYLWDEARQERDLKQEHARHDAILNNLEEDDLLALDHSRSSDYSVWAAAQALDEAGLTDEAMALLRRLAASEDRHPALCYPEIVLRLAEILRDRGDYEGALEMLRRAGTDDPELREHCRERRAEVLVLAGRAQEGLRLFEAAAAERPEDPWVPLSAAWALLQRGDDEASLAWTVRVEKAARRLQDRTERREALAEVERLRAEAGSRAERRALSLQAASPGGPPAGAPAAGRASLEEEILAAIDAEEIRLVRDPPRSDEAGREAAARLAALHARASQAWDDAVEVGNEAMIAAFDDLQNDVLELADRFGVRLPEIDGE